MDGLFTDATVGATVAALACVPAAMAWLSKSEHFRKGVPANEHWRLWEDEDEDRPSTPRTPRRGPAARGPPRAGCPRLTPPGSETWASGA